MTDLPHRVRKPWSVRESACVRAHSPMTRTQSWICSAFEAKSGHVPESKLLPAPVFKKLASQEVVSAAARQLDCVAVVLLQNHGNKTSNRRGKLTGWG